MPIKWPMPMPAWADKAFRYRGLKEIPGKNDNPTIRKWLISLKAWWKDDETSWCGTFVAHCLTEAGLPVIKHWYRAKAWSEYGSTCDKANIPFGAICVKSRQGGGHVFFAVAQSPDGQKIYGLGGNQSNMVNVSTFSRADIDHVRWPPTTDTKRFSLPIGTAQEVQAVSAGSEA